MSTAARDNRRETSSELADSHLMLPCALAPARFSSVNSCSCASSDGPTPRKQGDRGQFHRAMGTTAISPLTEVAASSSEEPSKLRTRCSCMTEELSRTPAKLREMAERCTRLAAGLTDTRVVDALRDYARELLEEAEQAERAERQPDA
jgi:hypothetical protein